MSYGRWFYRIQRYCCTFAIFVAVVTHFQTGFGKANGYKHFRDMPNNWPQHRQEREKKKYLEIAKYLESLQTNYVQIVILCSYYIYCFTQDITVLCFFFCCCCSHLSDKRLHIFSPLLFSLYFEFVHCHEKNWLHCTMHILCVCVCLQKKLESIVLLFNDMFQRTAPFFGGVFLGRISWFLCSLLLIYDASICNLISALHYLSVVTRREPSWKKEQNTRTPTAVSKWRKGNWRTHSKYLDVCVSLSLSLCMCARVCLSVFFEVNNTAVHLRQIYMFQSRGKNIIFKTKRILHTISHAHILFTALNTFYHMVLRTHMYFCAFCALRSTQLRS